MAILVKALAGQPKPRPGEPGGISQSEPEAVSRFVESGLGNQEVATISGHKFMQMIKHYTHLRTEDLVGKLDALDARSRHHV